MWMNPAAQLQRLRVQQQLQQQQQQETAAWVVDWLPHNLLQMQGMMQRSPLQRRAQLASKVSLWDLL